MELLQTQMELATYVFVEPIRRSLRGQIRCGFVVALRRRIAIEAMNRTRVDIAFVRNGCWGQGLIITQPGGCSRFVEFAVVDQNRCLDLRDLRNGRNTAIEWHSG